MAGWFTCAVNGASLDVYSNPAIPQVSITLTDLGGSFVNTAFTVADVAKREMLALALAAISNQLQVSAYVDDPTAGAATWNCYSLGLLAG
jgi:hypothetical protein